MKKCKYVIDLEQNKKIKFLFVFPFLYNIHVLNCDLYLRQFSELNKIVTIAKKS